MPKIYRAPHFGEITRVTIKVLGDFESGFLAGNPNVHLFLDYTEMKLLLESDDFQEKISHNTFKHYLKYVFKNSLEEIKKAKVIIDKEVLQQFEQILGVGITNHYGYIYYPTSKGLIII